MPYCFKFTFTFILVNKKNFLSGEGVGKERNEKNDITEPPRTIVEPPRPPVRGLRKQGVKGKKEERICPSMSESK